MQLASSTTTLSLFEIWYIVASKEKDVTFAVSNLHIKSRPSTQLCALEDTSESPIPTWGDKDQ